MATAQAVAVPIAQPAEPQASYPFAQSHSSYTAQPEYPITASAGAVATAPVQPYDAGAGNTEDGKSRMY